MAEDGRRVPMVRVPGLGELQGGEDADVVPDGRDLALERELAAMERERREAEREKPVDVVEYTPPTPRKLRPRTVAAVVLTVTALVLVMWYAVIPRADAELVVQYNEGVMGGINVDARVENHGTRAIEGLNVTILVQDDSDSPMSQASLTGSVPAHGSSSMDAISFHGSQYETYHIFVHWTFETAGETYEGSEHFVTEGDAMNLWFVQQMA